MDVYVDNLVIAGDNSENNSSVELQLSERYELKDLGFMKEFFGVKIVQESNGNIWMCRPEFIENILEKFSMTFCNTIDTPANPNARLTPFQEGDGSADPQLYQSAV